jgi:glycosyltransferase involved in cell wall biosynthesis
VANYKTKYGNYIKGKYRKFKNIIFLGPIYDIVILNNLRSFSNLYFHGHTVGGTNPSLLEAMSSHALVAANKNDFNETILKSDAYYFNNSDEVAQLLNSINKNSAEQSKVQLNILKITSLYSWNKITDSYVELFERAMNTGKKTTYLLNR